MIASTLLKLIAGDFICPIAFRDEYAYIISEGAQEFIDQWLSAIDLKLCQLDNGGSFFVAPRVLSPSDINKIRDDFLRFRDVYGPAVRMLQIIRSGIDTYHMEVGELIHLAELNQAVNESSTHENQVRSLQNIIRDGSSRFTNRELLKKLLEHLQKDGFLLLINEKTETYQTTGKISQLGSVLDFLSENTEFAGAVPNAEGEGESTGLLFDEPEVVSNDSGLDAVRD